MNVEEWAEKIVFTWVQDGLVLAQDASIAVIRRAIQLEERRKKTPRVALIRGLNTVLRRKERAAATAPKERA